MTFPTTLSAAAFKYDILIDCDISKCDMLINCDTLIHDEWIDRDVWIDRDSFKRDTYAIQRSSVLKYPDNLNPNGFKLFP